MKFLNHPIHVMLIHFPSALFPMDLACSCMYYYYGAPFTTAAFYAMMGGVLLGWLALMAGAFDLIGISQTRPELVKKVLLHGGVNAIVMVGYSILAYIAYRNYPAILPDGAGKIILKACLVLFMVVGNLLGGNLVLKDGIGTQK